MKKRVKSLNINVMLGLLAVLFISLGYLSMQGREGFREGLTDAEKKKNKEAKLDKQQAKDQAKEDLKNETIMPKSEAKTKADCDKIIGAKWNGKKCN